MTEIHERYRLKESFITNGGLSACIKLMTACSLPGTLDKIAKIFMPIDEVDLDNNLEGNGNFVGTEVTDVTYPDPKMTKILMREANLMNAIILLIKPFIHGLFVLRNSQKNSANTSRISKAKSTMRMFPFTLDKPIKNYEENVFKQNPKSEQSEREIKSVRSNQ
jgi:hypothetical protein